MHYRACQHTLTISGCLEPLLRRFAVPLYAHSREIPHLTGRRTYPPADPWAGGGLMAWSSPLYPRKPIHVALLPHSASAALLFLPGRPYSAVTESPSRALLLRTVAVDASLVLSENISMEFVS